jgi:cephalosporin hydroxylase
VASSRIRNFAEGIRASLDSIVAREYEKLYYRNHVRTWQSTRWMGHRVWKATTDLWMYQEIIHTLKPDLIVETGTAEGGSAYYFASLLDLLGVGRVITVDIQDFAGRPTHPRIEYLRGSSADPTILSLVSKAAADAKCVMVILDSDHSRTHVLRELDALATFVTSGSYLIVEDTNVNGHPVFRRHGPGPAEALGEWLPLHPEFSPDRYCERYYNTFNPGGYLKKL